MSVRANLARVTERITAACDRAHRDPAGVTLVAVSKGFGAERVQEALDAGIRVFGENRVLEAQQKFAEVSRPDLELHLIGHLQTNKVKPAVELFDLIQSLDSRRLAGELERRCAGAGRIMPVLLEVNIGREPNKFGFLAEEVVPALDELLQYTHLRIVGLMTVAPLVPAPEAARPIFRALRELRDRLRETHPDLPLPHLSMGMSDDFAVAIEEGATLIRLGRALFGERASLANTQLDLSGE